MARVAVEGLGQHEASRAGGHARLVLQQRGRARLVALDAVGGRRAITHEAGRIAVLADHGDHGRTFLLLHGELPFLPTH